MYAKVIVDIATSNIDKIFDYLVEEPIVVGSRVLVPFGARAIEGFVIELTDSCDYDPSKIKKIIKQIDDFAVITKEQLDLAKFMKDRFHIGYCDCFRLFLPPELRSGKVKEIFKSILVLNTNKIEDYYNNLKKSAKAQMGLINLLKDNNNQLDKAKALCQYSLATIKTLINNDVIIVKKQPVNRVPYSDMQYNLNKTIKLTDNQQYAINTIINNPNECYLLHGITGSGKTEVYMNIISNAVNNGKSAIMLVPEISLTPQLLNSFRARFGDKVALIHSGLSAGERFDEWRRILNGDAKIVVGARSAIFSPVKNLGVIVVDEEHEQSYNSDKHPRYVTSDVAEFLQKQYNCTLIMGSATPSMVSYHKAITKKYKLIEMLKRVNGQNLPPINLVDMGREIRLGNNDIFSNLLISELESCINNGNQAILFINRRGYASFVQCKECGWIAKCPNCDVTLALHKKENVLKCHYCGGKYKVFDKCPECGSEHLKLGSIGTEQVVKRLNELFPDVKVLRMDNDTTRTKNAHLNIITKFKNKEAQILVGTQMVAKGHDFPYVTLVGILEADIGLCQSSYMSTERTFALVTQVAGRAGRADKQGQVILQTYAPSHYVYKLATNYDYLSFYLKEINIREVTKFPPFSVIVRVLISSEEEELAINALKEYYNSVLNLKSQYESEFIYLGRMKSPISKIMNKFRMQIIMRLMPETSDEIINKIFEIDKKLKSPKVKCFIEVNAQDLR